MMTDFKVRKTALEVYSEAQRKRQAILDVLNKLGVLTQRQITDNSDIKYCTVNNIMRQLVAKGEVRQLAEYRFEALVQITASAASSVLAKQLRSEATKTRKLAEKQAEAERLAIAKARGNILIHRCDDSKSVNAVHGERARRMRPANGYSHAHEKN